MPAQNLRLSDLQLKGVKPASKDYVLTDGDGLQLRVRSSGSLLWNFNYREPVTKKRINIGFGTYPELSLANTRKKANDARELLAQGIDPRPKISPSSFCRSQYQTHHALPDRMAVEHHEPPCRSSHRTMGFLSQAHASGKALHSYSHGLCVIASHLTT
jgi:hypothetical protein